MVRVEACAFEQLGEVHHGRILSPRASCGLTTCTICWLEAIANDSAKQAVGGRSMVVLCGFTMPIRSAKQQLLRAGAAALDAHVVAWR